VIVRIQEGPPQDEDEDDDDDEEDTKKKGVRIFQFSRWTSSCH
jgi:hypothetical protein